MKILISEFMDEAAVASLQGGFDTSYDATLVDRREELLGKLKDVDALIVRNRTQVNGEILAAAPKLKVVGRLGVGLDNIDLPACRARNVEVIPATGANALAVAEYVIGTAMMLLRGVYFSTAAVAAGQWPRGPLSNGREIGGKTLGIIGFGGIGQLTAQLAQGLGMRVVATDPMISAASPIWKETCVTCLTLDQLLAECDVVSLHVPLVPETRNLINAARLAMMKADAVLINSARGSIIDEAALAAALKSKQLGGAALDVYDAEPLKAGSPLAECPNLILTPHVAGVTTESNTRVSGMIAERVAAFLASAR
ncbi:MAG: hydroxyacid dehydrogenase [Betaproteobacteria bacterium]|nr:hydroxyacid dehydrogenase [Betaproteobacteria bacterium]